MSAADRTPRGAAAAAMPWLLPLGAALALAVMGTRIWNPDLVGGARVPLGEGPATAQVTVPARMAGIQSAVIVQPRSPEAPLPQARTPERGVAPSHAGPGAPHKAASAPVRSSLLTKHMRGTPYLSA